MHSLDPTRPATSLAQVYLLERDAGLLCRILGLYAARGMDVLRADYSYAAQRVMKLHVLVDASHADASNAVRVLVDKVSSLVGVLAAAEHSATEQRAA